MSVDGKKLAMGLTKDFGDVDLFGFETPNLQETKKRLERELEEIKTLQAAITDDAMSIEDAKCQVSSVILTVTHRIQELRELTRYQNLHLSKMKKQAGDNWRESKYAYGISRTHALLYQVQNCISRLLECNNNLLALGAKLQGQATCNKADNLENLPKYVELPLLHQEGPVVTRLVKQRTEEWHELRRECPLTGSTLHTGLGLNGVKKMKDHIKHHIQGEGQEHSADVQQKLQHGTQNEPNAVATLANLVLPHYYPQLVMMEEGCYTLDGNEKRLMIVSPDGGLYHSDQVTRFQHELDEGGVVDEMPTPMLAIEIKCPYPGPPEIKLPVQYTMPVYYVPQVLAEMASMNVNFLLFCSWSSDSMVVHLVEFDDTLWKKIESQSILTYGGNSVVIPKGRSPELKNIKERLVTFAKENVTLMCEVPSISLQADPKFTQDADVLSVIKMTRTSIEESHQLLRKRSSEILVWLLSDTDRLWHAEIPHSMPVAYAMKGYSLKLDTMRSMCNLVYDHCKEHNIHIACL